MADRIITSKDNQPPLIDAEQLKKDYAHLETALAALENSEVPPVLEDDDDLAVITKTITDLAELGKKIETAREDVKRPILEADRTVQNFFKTGLSGRVIARIAALDKIGSAYLKKKRDQERIAREKAAEAAAEAARAAQIAAEEARAKLAATPAGGGTAAVVEVVKTQAQADAMASFAARANIDAAAPATGHTRTSGGSAGLQTSWTFEDLDVNTVDLEALRPYFGQADIEKALRAYIKSGRRSIKGANIVEADKARWRK